MHKTSSSPGIAFNTPCSVPAREIRAVDGPDFPWKIFGFGLYKHGLCIQEDDQACRGVTTRPPLHQRKLEEDRPQKWHNLYRFWQQKYNYKKTVKHKGETIQEKGLGG